MAPTIEAATRTNAGLAAEFRLSVMRLGRRIRSERGADYELGVAARSALGVLFRLEECTVGQLAAEERVRPPSMTRTVNCLVDSGFAVRRSSETDRRQVLIAISDSGRELILADRRRRDAWLTQRLAELTAEERAVLRRAAPIIERLATTA